MATQLRMSSILDRYSSLPLDDKVQFLREVMQINLQRYLELDNFAHLWWENRPQLKQWRTLSDIVFGNLEG